MNEEQKKAYLAAIYRVWTADGVITLSIGKNSPEVAELLASHGVNCAAFITAHNPNGELTGEYKNKAAQKELIREVGAAWSFLHGEGVDPKGEWPGEASLLILGISREAALELARKYHQVALLYIESNGMTGLIATAT